MNMLRLLPMNRILMDDNPGAGGGGSGSLLGNPPPANPSPGNPPPANNPPPGNPPPANDWRTALPKELQDNPTLKKYNSIDALAQAYVNAQKLIGGNKMPVPNENTTEQEWADIFKKLGLPEKVEEYNVKFKDGVSIQEEFVKEFQKTAHSLGILPKQAQKLAEWFSDINMGSEKKIADARLADYNKTVTELKAEWGKAFDLKVARANKVLAENGGKELMQHFVALGLGGDKKVMNFLASIGDILYKEDKALPGSGGGVGSPMTPKEIQSEINKVMGDPKHPYYLKDHPNHKAAVDQMRQWHEDLYSTKK